MLFRTFKTVWIHRFFHKETKLSVFNSVPLRQALIVMQGCSEGSWPEGAQRLGRVHWGGGRVRSGTGVALWLVISLVKLEDLVTFLCEDTKYLFLYSNFQTEKYDYKHNCYSCCSCIKFFDIPFIIFINNRNTLKKPYLSCCFFMNLSFWSSSCFLRRAVCMMACVCAINSWGLGTRGTTGGRMVAVPVDCKTNHMVSIEIILNHLCAVYVPSMNKQDAIGQNCS